MGLLPGEGYQGRRAGGLAGGVARGREGAVPAFEAAAKRYKDEQQEVEKAAREKKAERDARDEEAAHLFHRHHGFASSVAFIQVSIALGAVAALTRMRWIWLGSLLLGLTGAGLQANTLLR